MSCDNWKTSGMTLDEYKNFVRFADPLQAAEVLYAGLVERYNVARGSSGGYVASGAVYSDYGHYPGESRFYNYENNRLTALEDVMIRFCDLVNHDRWVMAQSVDSGATVRLWNGNMPELFTSVGLPEFADSNSVYSYHIPKFYLANQADAFIGIASGISLLTHVISTYPVKTFLELERQSGSGDDDEPFSVWRNVTSSNGIDRYRGGWESFSGYNGWSGNDNLQEAFFDRPTSVMIDNSGGAVLHFSAVFSGAIVLTDEDHSARTSTVVTSTLPTTSMRATVISGGTASLPVSGFYTYGKTLADLIPGSIRHTVAGSGLWSTSEETRSSAWMPYGGFQFSGFRNHSEERAFEIAEIPGQCIFFGQSSLT